MISLSNAVLVSALISSVSALSGTGKTTRYWDCCKPSCSWSGKASVSNPVRTCDRNQNTISDPNTTSGCDGGSSYTCADQAPWAVSDYVAYGFAAVRITGASESSWCCQCYKLTFTSGPAAGKIWVVQATNTGGDLGENHFDLLIPGGGVGLFNGCTNQYGSWNGGAQYGGVSSRGECANLPGIVQNGCNFRFDWFEGSDNPDVNWETVQCPSAITAKSNCVRNDQSSQPTFTTPQNPPPSQTSTPPSQTVTVTVGPTEEPEPTRTITVTVGPTEEPTPTPTPEEPEETVTITVTATADPGDRAPLYEQCGGVNWTGPTQCEEGHCEYVDDNYSVCLP